MTTIDISPKPDPEVLVVSEEEPEAGSGSKKKDSGGDVIIKPIKVSQSIRLGFILLGLGFLFHALGYCVPYWHVHEEVSKGSVFKTNYGLWRWCVDEYKYGRTVPSTFCYSLIGGRFYYDYVRAAQFFETVGFLAAVAAILLLLLGVCITSCRDKRILPILSAICAVAAAACIILGCIIFGAKDAEKPHLSWAFALAIVGGIFHGLAGVLIFLATLLKR